MNINNDDWVARRDLLTTALVSAIRLAEETFPQGERKIEKSRLHGTALLVHSIELARAIGTCVTNALPSAAAVLVRGQYEAALRGHIILHEIEIDELNRLLRRVERWGEYRLQGLTRRGPPKIQLDRHRWRCEVGTIAGKKGYVSRWHDLKNEIAQLYSKSVSDISVMHDLTHSGFTQSVQMLDAESQIGPNYSERNQVLLLYFTVRTTFFAIMTWPGMEGKFAGRIERQTEALLKTVKPWEWGLS